MTVPGAVRFAGWAAYLTAAASVVASVTLVVFLGKGQPYGKMNDIAVLVLTASLFPVLGAVHRILRPSAGWRGTVTSLVGVLALVIVGIYYALILAGAASYDRVYISLESATGLVGLWMVLVALLLRAGVVLPRGLVWMTLIAGLSQAVRGAVLAAGLSKLIIPTAVASLLAMVTYPVWGFWLGRDLLRGKFGSGLSK